MKFSEIKDKTIDELEKVFIDLKKELYNIQLLRANGEQKNPSRIRAVKKDVARVLTSLNQKKEEKKG